MKPAVQRMLDLVYPPRCPFCGQVLGPLTECPDCAAQLHRLVLRPPHLPEQNSISITWAVPPRCTGIKAWHAAGCSGSRKAAIRMPPAGSGRRWRPCSVAISLLPMVQCRQSGCRWPRRI